MAKIFNINREFLGNMGINIIKAGGQYITRMHFSLLNIPYPLRQFSLPRQQNLLIVKLRGFGSVL